MKPDVLITWRPTIVPWLWRWEIRPISGSWNERTVPHGYRFGSGASMIDWASRYVVAMKGKRA